MWIPLRCILGCILSKFYIKPQLSLRSTAILPGCILSKFYIKPQHFDFEKRINYVVSYRNSTSNHNTYVGRKSAGPLYLIEILHQTTTEVGVKILNVALYLIEILHQTTTCGKCEECLRRCILSKFYIKPQHITPDYLSYRVVSYRNSTSNHNITILRSVSITVVSYRNSTSNHNCCPWRAPRRRVVSYRNSTSNHNYRNPRPGKK